MIGYVSRQRLNWHLAVFVTLFLSLSSAAVQGQEDYVPGPVTDLHVWLGGECSFVPDLDVGECCRDHDILYQQGGDWFDRLLADLAFRKCILERNRPVVAEIYFWGVRTFGWLFFNYI